MLVGGNFVECTVIKLHQACVWVNPVPTASRQVRFGELCMPFTEGSCGLNVLIGACLTTTCSQHIAVIFKQVQKWGFSFVLLQDFFNVKKEVVPFQSCAQKRLIIYMYLLCSQWELCSLWYCNGLFVYVYANLQHNRGTNLGGHQ